MHATFLSIIFPCYKIDEYERIFIKDYDSLLYTRYITLSKKYTYKNFLRILKRKDFEIHKKNILKARFSFESV